MQDFEDDLFEDAIEIRRELRDRVDSIQVGLDRVRDEEESIEKVETEIEDAYTMYLNATQLIGMGLEYSEMKAREFRDFSDYTEPRKEVALDKKDVFELLPLLETQRDYEDALMRWAATDQDVDLEDYTGFYDMLDDVRLPGGLEHDDFQDDEIADY